MNFSATLAPVLGQGVPPSDFLTQLVLFGQQQNAISICAPNAGYDIFSIMKSHLGPWTSPVQRIAAMLEVLRVLAAEESSWNWDEGADPNGVGEDNILNRETGAFQVSANSMNFDSSLPVCVDSYLGAHDPVTFITGMKANHALAVEYVARLLRFSIKWDGPIERGVVQKLVSRAAMAEFQTLITQDSKVT